MSDNSATPSLTNEQSDNHCEPVMKHSGEGNALTSQEKIVGKTLKKEMKLSQEELEQINSKKGLLQLLSTKKVNAKKALVKLRYEQELEKLQIELVKLQRDVQLNGRRVCHHLRRPRCRRQGRFDPPFHRTPQPS